AERKGIRMETGCAAGRANRQRVRGRQRGKDFEEPAATDHAGDALSPPDFFSHFHDAPELRPLLVLGERVAFLGGGEAALPGKGELVEIDELRRLVDAALELVL